MKEQRLQQVLREVAEHRVPDTIDIWPDLYQKLESQRPPSPSRTALVTKRLSWVALALGTIFIFVSAAFAVGPLIRDLLKMDPALDAVESSGLGHPLNLTEMQEGVVVTLDWAYADENRIAIAYTVHGDEADQYQPVSLALSDDRGTEVPPLVGMGSADLSSVGLPSNQGGYIFSFDASAIPEQSDRIDLHVEIVLESSRSKQSLAPFAFDFALPSITPTSRVVELKQSITVSDITMTLKKVTVTPAEVITVMCLDDPTAGPMDWSPISRIDVKVGHATVNATVGQISRDNTGCLSSRYFPSLYDLHGSWTLTVTELVGFHHRPIDESSAPSTFSCSPNESGEYCSDQLRIQGPWVFEFDLP